MSIIETLTNMNLPEDTTVTLSCSEGCDVFVHNETEIETALAETDVVNNLSELVATSGLNVQSQWGGGVVDALREAGHLDDYERGSYTFSEYITEAITDNFYDVELVDYSTEKYDHKRGFTTLTAEVQVSLKELLETSPYLGCWEAKVQTANGTLTIED